MKFQFHRHLAVFLAIILIITTALVRGDISRSIGALAIGILLSLLVAHLVKTRIAEPLGELSLAIRRISDGEMRGSAPVRGTPEIAALLRDVNAMSRSLQTRENELQERTRRAESSILAIGEGVLVLSSVGQVTLANAAARRLLGTDRSLEGKTTVDLFRNPALEACILGAMRGGAPEPVDIELGSGSLVQVRASGVRNLTGATDTVVLVLHDKTEAARTETMRRDFVANVSHEFKTPLTVIRGYTETLLSGAIEDKNAGPEFLHIVERNARHLESLVADLLTLGRLEAELPASMEMIQPKALVDELIGLRRAAIGKRGIRVTNNCPDISVQADRARLTTAVSNLLDNAIAYNRQSGEIHIHGTAQNSSFTLSISDTGEGIPATDLQRIFERFYRVDRSRTRESGGTGLGLAIVKHAIESQGGSISVASKVGSGSTFTIQLPNANGAGKDVKSR
jgi:two-component system phosphate regulon sensor histidine kinase PhoR